MTSTTNIEHAVVVSANENGGSEQKPRRSPYARHRAGKIPWDEIDRLLVSGERITDPETGRIFTNYPCQRTLGERFGVAKSTVADFAKRHRCAERRKEAQLRQKRELSADIAKYRKRDDEGRVALALEEEIEIIDRYLLKFSEALDDGRVDPTNPADFNIMIRLKRFLQGGADARAEIHTVLSLETLAERHKRDRRDAEELDPNLTGEVLQEEDPDEAQRGPWGPKALPPAIDVDAKEAGDGS